MDFVAVVVVVKRAVVMPDVFVAVAVGGAAVAEDKVAVVGQAAVTAVFGVAE